MLEPDNKTFQDLAAKSKLAAATVKVEQPPPFQAAPTKTTTKVAVPRTAPLAKACPTPKEPSDEDADGEKIRGYKMTADGRKTTFFNNDLDEEVGPFFILLASAIRLGTLISAETLAFARVYIFSARHGG